MYLKILSTCAILISVASKDDFTTEQTTHDNTYLKIWPLPKPYPFISRMASEKLNLTCQVVNETDFISEGMHNLSWRIPMNTINNNRIVPFRLSDGVIGLEFLSLDENDSGDYTCLSDSFDMKVTTRLIIKPLVNRNTRKAYCSDRMFICPDGLCILERYVCDGRADCPFGADEDPAHCGENVCLGKIQCADGRCIPSEWCCTRRDVNCSTRIRPDCCDDSVQDQVQQNFEGSYLSRQLSTRPNDIDLLHMTVYTILACVLALVMIVLLLVTMLCRTHCNHQEHELRHSSSCQLYHRARDQSQYQGTHDHDLQYEYSTNSAFNLSQLLRRYDRVPFNEPAGNCDNIENNTLGNTLIDNLDCVQTSSNTNRTRGNFISRLLNLNFITERVNHVSVPPSTEDELESLSVSPEHNISAHQSRILQNGYGFIGHPISPPPYLEVLWVPPKTGPPPAYESVEDLVMMQNRSDAQTICGPVDSSTPIIMETSLNESSVTNCDIEGDNRSEGVALENERENSDTDILYRVVAVQPGQVQSEPAGSLNKTDQEITEIIEPAEEAVTIKKSVGQVGDSSEQPCTSGGMSWHTCDDDILYIDNDSENDITIVSENPPVDSNRNDKAQKP